MDQFPLNRAARGPAGQPKKIEQIATARTRRKPLGKQLKQTFLVGTAREAVRYSFLTVVVPAIQELIASSFKEGIDKMIFGESRRISSAAQQAATQAKYGTVDFVPYNRVSSGTQASSARSISQRARAAHDFDEIILESRTDALDVIEKMKLCVEQFGECTVSDLYLMVGLEVNHIDHTWGWRNLYGSGVRRLSEDAYILNLPTPVPLQS